MPTTIIDFSPQALEIDQIAQAAGVIQPNIPPPALPTMNSGININAITQSGNTFAASAPDILFTAEYAAQGQASAGVLVAWENYYNATHYELFRRVYTAQDDSWQRILIIDSTHLKAETDTFRSYITGRLNFDIKFSYYAILDTDVTNDQIVEYKVAAGCYPTTATIDYQLSLNSQGLLNKIPVNSTDTIFDLSTRVFSVPDYAWVLALINYGQYFGKKAVTESFVTQSGYSYAYVPRDLSVIPKMLQESIYFFGLPATLNNMFTITRDVSDGDTAFGFFDTVLECVTATSLSYSLLFSKLLVKYPDYDDYIARLKTGRVPTVSGSAAVVVPQYADTTSFVSMADFTVMFARLNTILVGLLFGKDHDVAAKVYGLLNPIVAPTIPGQYLLPPKPSPLANIPALANILPKTAAPSTITNIFGLGIFSNSTYK